MAISHTVCALPIDRWTTADLAAWGATTAFRYECGRSQRRLLALQVMPSILARVRQFESVVAVPWSIKSANDTGALALRIGD